MESTFDFSSDTGSLIDHCETQEPPILLNSKEASDASSICYQQNAVSSSSGDEVVETSDVEPENDGLLMGNDCDEVQRMPYLG